ncbi:MAG: NFACT RNA binding domain-containing protein [Candidatus Zixiibacteriota bacterium]
MAESSGFIEGGIISSVEFYRKERAVQIYIQASQKYCVTLSYHPDQSGFYILPAGKSALNTSEKYRPFARDIWESKINSIRQIPNDRIVEFEVTKNKQLWYLIFEIIGPNGNLWFLDENKIPKETLRRRKIDTKIPYQTPPLPPKINPYSLNREKIERLLTDNPGIDPIRLLEKNIYGFDYLMALTALKSGDSPDIILSRIVTMLTAYNNSDSPVHAYRVKNKFQYYPFKISKYEPEDKFPSLSAAQVKCVHESKSENEESQFRELTLKAVRTRLKKSKRLLGKLESDIKEAAQYEKYLQFADLLKININKLRRGLDGITVEDLYDNNQPVEIPLDSKLTGPENIKAYSRRFRKGKEGLDLMTRRKDNTIEEVEALEKALDMFENNFEQACNYYPELLPSNADTKEKSAALRKPYKEYQTSTGLTVLVGKTGSDNDRTTFEFARPYEMWFHASQCPGSHIVLKYPHKNFEPSKGELEEAAAAAAWASKARNSAKVPVSYTLKKYVRKPRRGKSGLVTIERETTILVEPRELQKREG